MGWYDGDWTYRAKITSQNGKVTGTQSNFPVYVSLAEFGTGHGIWSNVDSAGADIRITQSDGETLVPREIVAIDTTAKTGEVHFEANSLSSSSDTDFYVYYGNGSATEPSASDANGKYNVWDANFMGVYHLEEAAESVVSSTSQQVNEYDPSASTATSVTGILDGGKALDFNGSTNTIIFQTGVDTYLSPTSALQFELWFNADAKGSDVLLYCRGDSTTKGYGFWFWNSNLRAQIGSSGWSNLTYALSSISLNTDYHIVGNWDGSTYRLYVNGSQVDSGAYSGSQTYSSSQMTIGTRASGDDFDGHIDELRIHDTARSASWIATQYNNQSDPATFWVIGAEEEDTPAGATFIPKMQII